MGYHAGSDYEAKRVLTKHPLFYCEYFIMELEVSNAVNTRTKQLIAVGAMAAVIGCEVALVSAWKVPEVEGVWKDVHSSLCIEFYGDGTYEDTLYGVRLPYFVQGDTLLLENLDGTSTAAHLSKTLQGRTKVLLNGVEREFVPFSGTIPEESHAESTIDCTTYSLMSAAVESCTLKLYANNIYELKMPLESSEGTYLESANEVVLVTSEGLKDIWKKWENGLASTVLDTSLQATVLKENVLQDRGYALSGSVFDTYSETSYNFYEDGTVTVTASNGRALDFFYHADSSGLVTLSDMAGLSATLQLWYDDSEGVIYSHVFLLDSWAQFLSQGGAHAN